MSNENQALSAGTDRTPKETVWNYPFLNLVGAYFFRHDSITMSFAYREAKKRYAEQGHTEKTHSLKKVKAFFEEGGLMRFRETMEQDCEDEAERSLKARYCKNCPHFPREKGNGGCKNGIPEEYNTFLAVLEVGRRFFVHETRREVYERTVKLFSFSAHKTLEEKEAWKRLDKYLTTDCQYQLRLEKIYPDAAISQNHQSES